MTIPDLSDPTTSRDSEDVAASLPGIACEKYTLPNGLQLLLHIDRKLPVVHVNQWYHVGSKNERRGRTGFAHLFEHIMFQGSLHASGDYFTYVERAGANLREGGVNGTTDFDRTNYFATVPSGNLELLLWVESDRLATLADALTQENLDNQREVVRNERRQSLENQPYGRAFTLITENLHPADHPYSWDVIGSHEDLIAASLDDVKEFFHRYYTPNNLSLAIAGDFDPGEARRLVEIYFGDIPPGPVLDRPSLYMPRLHGRKVVLALDRVPQERSYVTRIAPPYFAAGQAELDLASLILADGLSSRLPRALVYDRQLCTDVSAFNQVLEISSSFTIVATARPGASLEEIEKIIDEKVHEVASGGVTGEELDRAKTKWEYAFVSGLERIGGFGGKADLLNQYNVFLRDPNRFADDMLRYRSATPESIRSTVARFLDNDDRLVVRFRPETSGRATIGTSVDRSKQPSLGVDRPFTAPHVRSATLPNGLEIFVAERHDLPKVALTFAVRAGSTADPRGKQGLSHLTTTTVTTGTRALDALGIEDALGDLGTSIDPSGGRECSLLSVDVLERNLRPALSIVADVIRNATFPRADFDREKSRHLDGLSQQSNNPTSVAARVRPMLGFGHDHPYGRPMAGLPGTVTSIEREEVAGFHARWWCPSRSALIFAGAITLERAVELASETLGSWSDSGAPSIIIPPATPVDSRAVYVIDRQEAAQTVVSQILPGPWRKAEDFYAFRLVDSIWGGGGFGTRLNLNLREDKGYTYGVFSSIASYAETGLWFAHGAVQTDKTSESVVEFIRELEDLAGRSPISERELEDARAARVRGYAQQFESLSRIAGQIAALWYAGLPMSEPQREVDETSRATLDEVRSAAERHVRPDEAILLLVGDLQKIEKGIRDLDIGDLVVLDVEGRRLTPPGSIAT
ncbi:MAG TPA: pitrilysin family protein [Thermoanaerobaculia bacterium]|nr:pitrilysin family protein [Thermoanaerobaculia bacterium]